VQRHTRTVDITDLQRHDVAGAQPGAIGHRERCLVLRIGGRRDQTRDFLAAQHHGELARLAHAAHLRQRLGTLQRDAEEKPQGGDRAVERETGGTGLDQV
jgi:hypothetical protein